MSLVLMGFVADGVKSHTEHMFAKISRKFLILVTSFWPSCCLIIVNSKFSRLLGGLNAVVETKKSY